MQVLIAEVGRVGCESVSKRLLGLLGCLYHGRSTECTALRELGSEGWYGVLVVGVRRVLIGLGNDLIEIATTSVGVGLVVDVLRPAEDRVECGRLLRVTLCTRIGVLQRRCLPKCQPRVQLAAIRLIGFRIDRIRLVTKD